MMRKVLSILVILSVLCGTMIGFGGIGIVSASTITKNIADIAGLTMLDVTYSEDLNLFVAVGNDTTSGKIFTSKDSLNWTLAMSFSTKFRVTPNTTSGSVMRQRNIVWSKALGKFVGLMGADGEKLVTSTDGINWTIASGPSKLDFITADDYRIIVTRLWTSADGGNGRTHVYETTDLSTWTEIGSPGIGSQRFALTNNAATDPLYFYWRRYGLNAFHYYTVGSPTGTWTNHAPSTGTDGGVSDAVFSETRGDFLASFDAQGNTLPNQGILSISTTGVKDNYYNMPAGDNGTTAIAVSGTKIIIGSKNGSLFTAPEAGGVIRDIVFSTVAADEGSAINAEQIKALVISPDNVAVAVTNQSIIRVANVDAADKYRVVTQYSVPKVFVASNQYKDGTNDITTLTGHTSVTVSTTVTSNVESQPVTFVVALYDQNGVLKCVTMESKPVTSTTPLDFTGTVSDQGNNLAGYKIKTFVWDGASTMQPLSGASEFQK